MLARNRKTGFTLVEILTSYYSGIWRPVIPQFTMQPDAREARCWSQLQRGAFADRAYKSSTWTSC